MGYLSWDISMSTVYYSWTHQYCLLLMLSRVLSNTRTEYATPQSCQAEVEPDVGLVNATQVAGDAVRELPTWAGPDVIIAATMSKLDGIVAAASAQVCTSLSCACYNRAYIYWHCTSPLNES